MKYNDIPNTNTLLKLPSITSIPSDWAVSILRELTNDVRDQIRAGLIKNTWSLDDWDRQIQMRIQTAKRLRYQPVINATGIVVHTNLGRAPLPAEVVSYMQSVSGYTDLELQLEDGKRGGRLAGIRQKICQLTGAEDAVVVNNNAAAVLLVLSAMASNRSVIVSRGELVEIGGSFRIPDVIQQGGAILKEVGCTNRLHLYDIEQAIDTDTGAILRVHTSNYRIVGFTSQPTRKEICQLGQGYGVPVVEDLGSGLLSAAPNVPWKDELEREESIARALHEGVEVVTASGDKLLGGVQAGLIIGKQKWIEKCRKHPLYRALRLDKTILAGLEATLQMHLEGRQQEIPVWDYLQRSADTCHQIAQSIATGIEGVSIEPSQSLVGGGALPERCLDTWAVVLSSVKVETVAKQLRTGTPAVMARIQQDTVWLDVRTIALEEVSLVRQRLVEILR